MNPERQVSDMEMRWIVETDEHGAEHLVAHWVGTDSPELTVHAAA